MADYNATFRSNYFGIKDAAQFRAFCEEFDLEMVTKVEEGGTLYAFLNKGNEAGVPFTRYDKEANDWEPVDFLGVLAEHLLPDYVAVIFEIGSEKMRYLVGEAFAVNSEGENIILTLSEIYRRAKSLGSICTDCSY